MNRLEIDSSAFDQVHLHDVDVYGFFLQRRGCQISLILDIDYRAVWNLPDGDQDCSIVPATLTFLDVVDLQIHLDWGVSLRPEEPYGVISNFSGQVTIYDFRRFAYTDPVYTEGCYVRYELDFSLPPDGRISLGAKDFKIVGRQDGVHFDQQTLDPAQRAPFVSGDGRAGDGDA
jgi:hypothetical protein